MPSIFLVVIGAVLISFLALLVRIFAFHRRKPSQQQENFDLDAVFETNKTIWQHNIEKVVTVPHYQYQEAFNVFPYFSDYQESNNFLRTNGASNHHQNEFLSNMHQHEGEVFQFWSQQQQKILRSFDETGLGISPDLVNFFLGYYNYFLEAFRVNAISYLVNQILVAEIARALNEKTNEIVRTANYDEFILTSKTNFFANYESNVDQIIQTLHDDINTQYSTFYQQQKVHHEEQAYQQRYQKELDEVARAYKMLEATEIMSDDDIKQNYRRLAKQYHPDHNRSEEAKIKMAQINAAYDLIKKIRSL